MATTETAPPPRPALGILAGGGVLPAQLAEAADAAGRRLFIIGLEGFVDTRAIAQWPHEILRLGAVGRMLALLRAHHCTDIVMAGTVRRPSFFDLRPDIEGARILGKLGRAAFAGDDGLLAALVRVLGEEGFQVLGVQDVLSEALAPTGLLGRIGADAQAMSDITRGITVARALGAADVGQGCVIQQGLVLAVEAIEGTDAMIARAGQFRRDGPGGVLVKLVKPGQDRRADLPTIGPNTVRESAAAGLRGIAFEAGGALVVDRAACIAAADAAGLFLLGVDPTQFS